MKKKPNSLVENQTPINYDDMLIHRGRLIHDRVNQMIVVDDEKSDKKNRKEIGSGRKTMSIICRYDIETTI